MIYEWKLDGEVRNFGHAIYEVLYDKKDLYHWSKDQDKMFFLGGTYIHEDFIIDALNSGYDPVFIDCAMREEMVSDEFLEMGSYRSTYGSETEEMLSWKSIPVDFEYHPIYNLPDMHPRGNSNALAVVVRNIKDPGDYDNNAMFRFGSDGVFSPVVETTEDIYQMIDIISGARFVLTGSLKAAMVADSYGIPFAPLDADGYVDCPSKWNDWLFSLGITEVAFSRTVRDGRDWYQSVVKGRV
jgi:hypothetical protein